MKALFLLFSVNISAIIANNSKLGPTAAQKLIIDTDGGTDDAVAIFMAILYEKYFNGPKIMGITTVAGNVEESQVFINVQKTLNVANRFDIPIFRGSNHSLGIKVKTDGFFGNDGLGDLDNMTYIKIEPQPQHAALALNEISKKYEDEITLLTLGPLTNVALAVGLDPEFIGRLNHLYIAAGNTLSEKLPNAEFNVILDAEAYNAVVQRFIVDKVTLIPITPIKAAKGMTLDWRIHNLGAINTDIMHWMNLFERISNINMKKIDNVRHWTMLDVEAMAMVLNNDLISEYRYTNHSVILCGSERGKTPNKFTDSKVTANSRIAFPETGKYFKEFILRMFSAELNNE